MKGATGILLPLLFSLAAFWRFGCRRSQLEQSRPGLCLRSAERCANNTEPLGLHFRRPFPPAISVTSWKAFRNLWAQGSTRPVLSQPRQTPKHLTQLTSAPWTIKRVKTPQRQCHAPIHIHTPYDTSFRRFGLHGLPSHSSPPSPLPARRDAKSRAGRGDQNRSASTCSGSDSCCRRHHDKCCSLVPPISFTTHY